MIAKMMFIASLALGGLLVVVVHLVWLVAWLIGRWGDSVVPYAPFGWTAFALALLAWSVLAYGFFVGRFRLDINNINYTHTEIPPAFKGYKIVHISDLHLSTFDDRPAALQRLVDSINAQQPDVICFTGDLVTMGVAEVLGKTDIPLTLSGHTHAAQVRLFGWTPAAWAFRETAGRYDSAGQTLYINVGLGGTLPVRLNCPAEITVITLQ